MAGRTYSLVRLLLLLDVLTAVAMHLKSATVAMQLQLVKYKL